MKYIKEDLVIGEFYFSDYGNNSWIIKYEGFNNKTENLFGASISTKFYHSFYPSGDWGNIDTFNVKARLATEMEKYHLKQCIFTNGYVDIESLKYDYYEIY